MLKGKTILVVGAGGLIGRKLVGEALKENASIIAADIDVDAMVDSFESAGISVDHTLLSLCQLDITNELETKNFFEQLGEVSGAVNCTYPRNKEYGAHFYEVALDSFNENLGLHLGSAFLFSKMCALYFKKKQGDFSLVNLASIYGVVAPDFDIYSGTKMTMPVEYAAIKSAIIQLTKYVSSYVKDSRFRANVVSPGGIFDSQPEAFLQKYCAKTNGKGMLLPEDITGSILFLLSDKSKFLTGQNLVVDDGFTL